MRGALAGQPSPFPLLHRLPAALQEGDFLARFLGGFDATLAPLFLTLDSLDAYVDPQLAPEDFLDWLTWWVGLEVDESWSRDQQRRIVADAVAMHGRRGTTRGIIAAVRLITGGEVEVSENGGATWSTTPGSELPGTAGPSLRVRVRPPEGEPVDQERLSALVAAVKPAHVPHTVEVVSS